MQHISSFRFTLFLAVSLLSVMSLTAQNQTHWLSSGSDIYHPGQVAIGTTETPQGDYLLYVKKIACEEVAIQLSDFWADYVFEDGYTLLPLDQLQTYIDQNGHLPNMPPAKEVEENGLDMGPATGRLLEKLEELQLYLIEDYKRDEVIRQQLEELQKY